MVEVYITVDSYQSNVVVAIDVVVVVVVVVTIAIEVKVVIIVVFVVVLPVRMKLYLGDAEGDFAALLGGVGRQEASSHRHPQAALQSGKKKEMIKQRRIYVTPSLLVGRKVI